MVIVQDFKVFRISLVVVIIPHRLSKLIDLDSTIMIGIVAVGVVTASDRTHHIRRPHLFGVNVWIRSTSLPSLKWKFARYVAPCVRFL